MAPRTLNQSEFRLCNPPDEARLRRVQVSSRDPENVAANFLNFTNYGSLLNMMPLLFAIQKVL